MVTFQTSCTIQAKHDIIHEHTVQVMNNVIKVVVTNTVSVSVLLNNDDTNFAVSNW